MSESGTRTRPAHATGDTVEYPWERPLGARAVQNGVEFRVWAPRAGSVAVRLGDHETELSDAGYGVYEAVVEDASAGDDYKFVLDGGDAYPDPATRWQPEGLRGPSRVVDLDAVSPLADPPALDQHVIYELHIGTFTPEGTFAAAVRELPGLAQLGVTAIEIMPVAEFPGRHGWGYDGVYLSAAQSSYGGPHELAELVRTAHDAGLAVILDVVYNHVGASGTPALDAFGPYFTEKYETPWGRAVNYDDADCDGVREWVIQSAEGWVRDFGFDGLRLDAIWSIFDSSAEHIVAAVARRVHDINPSALVIAESGLNDPKLMRPRERGGYACDATWADDFHHSLRTLVTDESDGYYAEFGRVADLAKAFHRPHVHDGEYSEFRHRRFGAPADDVAPEQFVVFSQDHDQVGNRAYGDRMPAAGAAAGRAVHAALTVRPDAVHGRGVRRGGSLPVLLRPHRCRHRGCHARRTPPRVRVVRAVRRRDPGSAGRGHVRALKADASGRSRDRAPVRGPAGGAPADRRRRRR